MPSKAFSRFIPFLFAGVLVVAGCGSGGDKTDTTGKPAGETPAPQGGTTKDVVIKDSKVGTGPKASPGDTVWVGYVGMLTNKTVFDSSEKNGGKPFAVTLGAGSVIEGWEKGLIGSQAGGKRNLLIPYQMAYGEAGRPPTIPAKADLVFDIEVLAVVKQDEQDVVDGKDLKVGTGAEVKENSKVTVDYVGTMVNGTQFDSTIESGKPFTFTMGQKEALPGLEAGILGMKVGGKRHLMIPPKLGLPFGNQTVPPNNPLIIDVEVKAVK